MPRTATVSGTFYSSEKASLRAHIEDCFLGPLGPGRLPEVRPERIGKVLGLVSPHAGFMYSGSAAAFAYTALAEDGIPDIAVMIGPNHSGLGETVAISAENEWLTPLGALEVDRETADAILRKSTFAKSDDMAHLREHSLEVQLPFLQYVAGNNIKIVPITIAHLSARDAQTLSTDLGSAISDAISGKNAVIIASTDFTHYEPRQSAAEKDSLVMDHILHMDPAGMISTVYQQSITMCGVVGTAVMLQACKNLGASGARKLTYYTSGDVIGDPSQVVGYGALSVEREN